RAVHIVAGDGKVLAGVIIVGIGCSDHHHFAVRLKCDRIGDVSSAVKIGRHSAAQAERLIKSSGRRLRQLSASRERRNNSYSANSEPVNKRSARKKTGPNCIPASCLLADESCIQSRGSRDSHRDLSLMAVVSNVLTWPLRKQTLVTVLLPDGKR